MAKRRLPDLADDHRCTRNGTNWRCHLPRLPGKSYCQKHHLFNLARSQSRSKSKSNSSNNSSSAAQTLITNPNLKEIWAFFSPEQGPPRLYARVDRRIPNQSLVEVTPLLPHPDPAADVACGVFSPSSFSTSSETRDMSTFSHRVWFEVEERDGEEWYKIYPSKGEVWAVEVYGWVEIVSGFGDGEGPSGLVLVEDEDKVAGEGERVFRRRLYEGCELIRRFTVEEMGMFSHRVSGARVVGAGHRPSSSSLQVCMRLTDGGNLTGPHWQGTTCHQYDACSNALTQGSVEGQAQAFEGISIMEQPPDDMCNVIEQTDTLEGVSIVKGVTVREMASIITESVSVLAANINTTGNS